MPSKCGDARETGGYLMQLGSFQKIIQVGYTQGDRFARMTPGYMLREAQQIAMEHCDQLGYTVPELLRIHRVFLLCKLQLTVNRAPVEGERIRLTTTANVPKRIIYKRVCAFDALDGERLATVDSRWALVDTTTRRITRDAPPAFLELLAPAEDVSDIRARRANCDEEAQSVRVTYSMTDTNRHVNNAFYADWVCDALEPLLIRGAQVRDMKLFYHHEAVPGDTVRIRSAVQDGVYCFSGDVDSGRCFDAEVELTAPEAEGEAPLPYYA